MDKKISHRSVSVVVTVFNESSNIVALVDSLLHQDTTPHEIIIVDGGSTDDTFQILKKLSGKHSLLKVFQKTGNRSVGRNYGVSMAKNPSIIAFTDAGCIPHGDWLRNIIAPFGDPSVQVVSGYYEGRASSVFEKCLVPYALVMPDKSERTEFYPSTRSMAITKAAWDKSGGFDVRLFHNEDYAFAHWLKKMGFNFHFAKKAIVSWIPRKNLKSAAWMFMRFAIGDAQIGLIRPKVRMLYTRYLAFTYLAFVLIQFPRFFPLIWAGMAVYILWSIVKNYKYVNHPMAIFWLPVIQITADFSVMIGTLLGLMSKAHGLS